MLWIGAWPNGTVMGTDEALYLAQGREIAAAFDAMSECSSHSLYAEVVRQPACRTATAKRPLMFEDCTVREGRTVEEAIAALGQWIDSRRAAASTSCRQFFSRWRALATTLTTRSRP